MSSTRVFRGDVTAQSFAALDPPPVRQTMEAWERFVTGEPLVASALSKTLLASWQRSLRCGVEPRSRLAPMTAAGDLLEQLRHRNHELLWAAQGIDSTLRGEVAGLHHHQPLALREFICGRAR